jgi:tRNA (mo5U34)-methyltransferase
MTLPWFAKFPGLTPSQKSSLEKALVSAEDPRWGGFEAALERVLSHPLGNLPEPVLDQPRVVLGDLFPSAGESDLMDFLKLFIPWKKGPFQIFGHKIDTEWRSDLKWDRLTPYMDDLKNQTVCDIGAHNGYYMFRMAAQNPDLVIGLEPYVKHNILFRALKAFGGAKTKNLFMTPLGVEHTHLFGPVFDTVFCLGILYHHRDPVGLLGRIKKSLKPQGTLFIDCQGIPGTDPLCLIPQGRYAKARGVWFLPTLEALKIWVRRSGFRTVELCYSGALTPEEQRSYLTPWAPIPSLQEFLDPDDPTRTVEGYPAPWRFYLKVQP